MTPARRKAKQLVEMLKQHLYDVPDRRLNLIAINCALICVEEVMSELSLKTNVVDRIDEIVLLKRREFYTQVQTELKAMRDE